MKLKTVYVCTECGAQSSKWSGQCPHCGKWNSLTEEVIDTEPVAAKAPKRPSVATAGENRAARFSDMTLPTYIRTDTGLSELDRVLGGGLVTGSVVLLSGEPGIGKSTLLMQTLLCPFSYCIRIKSTALAYLVVRMMRRP